MRKRRKRGRDSEEANQRKGLDKVLADLRKRVEELERRVFYGDQNLLAIRQDRGQGRLGRTRGIPLRDYIQRRDALINWLEDNWPELEVAFRKAHSAQELLPALKIAVGLGTYPWQPPFYREPEKYLEVLWAFLNSKRYCHNPRNLAGAMAGLPEISWKRSFDIGVENPARFGLGRRAIRAYLHRKFPERFREVVQAKNSDEVLTALAHSRTRNPLFHWLKAHAEDVPKWLKEGLPRQCPK